MLIVALLAGCEPYIPREALASCTSERVDSAGVVVITDYDANGWPVREETRAPGAEPVIATTEYSRVAGRVVESLTLIGGGGYTRLYDGHEHLEEYTSNGFAPETDFTCTLTHDDDRILSSSCTNGIETTYDDCQNVDSIVFEGGEESYGYSYRDCQVLSGQMLGQDAAGPYAENFQHALGREVARVRERDGELFSTFTTWDCP